jgi:hypothetical protein
MVKFFLPKISLLNFFSNSVPDPWHFGRYGFGSLDPYFWLKDPDFFVTDLQDTNKQTKFLNSYAFSFFKIHLHHSSKIKSLKKSHHFFFLLMEGSGSGQISYGSGSGRSKKIRLLRTNLWKVGGILTFLPLWWRQRASLWRPHSGQQIVHSRPRVCPDTSEPHSGPLIHSQHGENVQKPNLSGSLTHWVSYRSRSPDFTGTDTDELESNSLDSRPLSRFQLNFILQDTEVQN